MEKNPPAGRGSPQKTQIHCTSITRESQFTAAGGGITQRGKKEEENYS